MGRTLRILQLEESKKDAEQNIAILEEEGFTCLGDTALTQEDFLAKLELCAFDLILADYTLPAFDGRAALAIARETCPDVPFIFVSGAIGEETATELLKGGASDFVVKGKRSRLGIAANRALKEREDKLEKRRTEQKLREIEGRYRGLIEHVGLGISLISPEMKILAMNGRMKKWFPDIDISKHPVCFEAFNSPPRDTICSYCPTHKTFADGHVHESVTETPADSEIRHYRVISSPVYDDDGNVTAVLEMVEDITLRKHTEEALLTSERRYRSLFENMQDGAAYCKILYKDGLPEDFLYVEVNSSFEKLTGLTDVLGKKVTEVIPGIKESHPELLEIYGRVASTGVPERFELYLEQLKAWFSISAYSPEQEHFVTVFDNITERKRSEESLMQSEARFATVFHSSPVGIVISRLSDGTIYDVNNAFLTTYGFRREEVIGHSSLELKQWVNPEDRETMVRILRERGRVQNLEATFRRKTGETGALLISAERIGLAGEECLLAMFQDITERRRSEDEVYSLVRMWNNTFDAISDAVSILDENGTILRCNKAMIELTGKDPEEIVNHSCWEVLHHAEGPGPDDPFLMMKESRRRASVSLKRHESWFSVTADPIIDQSGKLIGAVHIMTDITDHKLFEARLKESESKFRSLAEQSLVGTYIIQDDRFAYVNPRFAEMFGYRVEEIIGHKKPQDLTVPDDWRIVQENIRKRKTGERRFMHYEFRGLQAGGDVLYLETYGSSSFYEGRTAIIGALLDITEKKKLETELLQVQKMEAVGQLTSGIAHDFNNILSAIIGYASLLQMRIKESDPNRPFVDQILAGTERAASLTRSLSTFSRKQMTTLTKIDINESIRSVEKLLLRIIGEDIDLRTNLAPGNPVVRADSGQIEQILMNLATNARDAMPHGGFLSIETSVIDGDALPEPAENRSLKYVMITVTDTGAGMDEKTREKIFEPFFTMKDLGRGTGLGLWMVYGIIKQHDGFIHCYSEPGLGTTFRIYLPLVPPDGTSEKTDRLAPEVKEGRLHGSETILVVEDDEAVKSLAKTTLETFGYTVIAVQSGEDAVDYLRQNKNKIQLVLSDVIMPGMSGAETGEAIGKLSQDVPIVFMSGYPADIIHKRGLLKGNATIIAKPFSPTVLLEKVREVFDKK